MIIIIIISRYGFLVRAFFNGGAPVGMSIFTAQASKSFFSAPSEVIVIMRCASPFSFNTAGSITHASNAFWNLQYFLHNVCAASDNDCENLFPLAAAAMILRCVMVVASIVIFSVFCFTGLALDQQGLRIVDFL